MNTNQAEEQAKFKITLNDFLLSNGIIKNTFEFEFEPFRTYQAVCRGGGFHAITNRNEWGNVCNEVGTKQEGAVKEFYCKYLFPFEKKNYLGVEQEEQHPTLLVGVPRKMVKTDSQRPKNDEYNGLIGEIGKALEEEEESKKLFYLKKSKLQLTKAESKKIIVGLQPFMPRQMAVYSLNMLLLHSINSHPAFLFENHDKIFTALSHYAQRIHPPTTPHQFQDLRTITLIFRNFTMNPLNLKHMLGSPIFTLLVNMFNSGVDQECSKNIVDIMHGLVKVGWDCQRILDDMHTALLDQRSEDVEGSVELLRGLIDERDEHLAPSVTQNIRVFLRVLMSTDIGNEVKEQVFEILAFVTDISTPAREELLKNSTLLSVIIGILQQMKSQQKLIQFAALTLSNMASSANSKEFLKPYQSDLILIGFSDDSLAGIISNIVTELSQ